MQDFSLQTLEHNFKKTDTLTWCYYALQICTPSIFIYNTILISNACVRKLFCKYFWFMLKISFKNQYILPQNAK